jgi:enoyl-CoA hydratase/carnithine racemase
MAENILLIEEDHHIEVLTLNRPEVSNAFNMDLLHALREEINAILKRDQVRVVIITGSGEKAFCSGADLNERAALDEEGVKEYIHTIRELFTSIESLNKPVIAAINGIAVGGGTELALACDIRIASSNATLGLIETRLGVIPGAGGTQRLPRLIGPGKAKELIFMGRKVGAEEALRIGLVNQVCEKDRLIERSREMATVICEAGPIAVEQAKYAINAGMDTDLKAGLEVESKAYWVTLPTRDRLEGLKAFFEKRKPTFRRE